MSDLDIDRLSRIHTEARSAMTAPGAPDDVYLPEFIDWAMGTFAFMPALLAAARERDALREALGQLRYWMNNDLLYLRQRLVRTGELFNGEDERLEIYSELVAMADAALAARVVASAEVAGAMEGGGVMVTSDCFHKRQVIEWTTAGLIAVLTCSDCGAVLDQSWIGPHNTVTFRYSTPSTDRPTTA